MYFYRLKKKLTVFAFEYESEEGYFGRVQAHTHTHTMEEKILIVFPSRTSTFNWCIESPFTLESLYASMSLFNRSIRFLYTIFNDGSDSINCIILIDINCVSIVTITIRCTRDNRSVCLYKLHEWRIKNSIACVVQLQQTNVAAFPSQI